MSLSSQRIGASMRERWLSGGGRGSAGGAVAHAVPCDDGMNMQGNKYFLHRAQELSLGDVMHFTPTLLHRRQLILVSMVSSTIDEDC